MLACLINSPSFIPNSVGVESQNSTSYLEVFLFYLFKFTLATQIQWTLGSDLPWIEQGSAAGSNIRSRVRFRATVVIVQIIRLSEKYSDSATKLTLRFYA